MNPTNRLRFIQRTKLLDPFLVSYNPITGRCERASKTYSILQQWWANYPDCYEDWVMKVNGEWRDVEIEVEE